MRFAGSKGVREENSARPKKKATTPASSIVEEERGKARIHIYLPSVVEIAGNIILLEYSLGYAFCCFFRY